MSKSKTSIFVVISSATLLLILLSTPFPVVASESTITIRGKAMLEEATDHSGITIEVWLNGQSWNVVASTTTAVDGSYMMDNVPPLSGNDFYSVIASKEDYSGDQYTIWSSEAPPGSTVEVPDLILHGRKWVAFNWVYQPNGTTDLYSDNLPSGTTILYSIDPFPRGFIFSTATRTGVVADLYFSDSEDCPYSFLANNGSGGIHDMGAVPMESVAEAPDASLGVGLYEFYNCLDTPAVIGHTYCIVTRDGAHYAKIHIIVPPTALSISQRDFRLLPKENMVLTATLTFDGKPLANKTVSWHASSGTISPLYHETNSAGQISAIFTAPEIYSPDPVIISASFAGEGNKYSESSDNSFCTLLFAVLTFNKIDGTPLANAEIYYGYSSDQITNYLGTTNDEGKIELENSDFGGRTIYFKTSDGRYMGSTSISSTGGEATVKLTEVSQFPILWVIATIAVVVIAIGVVVLIKKSN